SPICTPPGSWPRHNFPLCDSDLDGAHRLLGKTANLNVEIIPGTSVTLVFAEVDQSVLSIVEQLAGDQEEGAEFSTHRGTICGRTPERTHMKQITRMVR